MIEPEMHRILIVDDNPNVRKLVKFSIQDPAFEIVTAANGREAIELAATRKFDLAILDALMPGVHGFEVARHLRDHPLQGGIKIFMLTSIYKQRQYELEAKIKYGVDEYLHKPFNPDELKQRVLLALGLSGDRSAPGGGS